MNKPIIGITADTLNEPTRVINLQNADYAPRDIKEAIHKAGGVPIILPFPEDVSQAPELASQLIEFVDGLILPGGTDVDPTLFGEEPIFELGRTNLLRDVFELEMVKAAVASEKSVFGICRGLQLINVAFGGTLWQDLHTQSPESFIKHSQEAAGGLPTHHIQIDKENFLFDILGKQAYVNSRHHQAVKKLADGFVSTAKAADSVIEAIEDSKRRIFAVQWHPENMAFTDEKQFQIFDHFVKSCQ